MPLYYANIRSGTMKKGYGQTGRMEYQRSSPSRALVIVDAGWDWVTMLMYQWMHTILQAWMEPVEKDNRKDEAWGTNLSGFFPKVMKLEDALPLSMPKVAVCLNSNNPPKKVLDKRVMGLGKDVTG
jgi:hypothetical protein